MKLNTTMKFNQKIKSLPPELYKKIIDMQIMKINYDKKHIIHKELTSKQPLLYNQLNSIIDISMEYEYCDRLPALEPIIFNDELNIFI